MSPWLTLDEAAIILAKPSRAATYRWLWRYNLAHPESQIRRIHGRLNRSDLERAIEEMSLRFAATA